MIKYPENVNEAAVLLDKVCPEWASEVDVNVLDMSENGECILGQIYLDYVVGIRTIFGINFNNDIEDDVFGRTADLEEWKLEIRRRTTKVDLSLSLQDVGVLLSLLEKDSQPNLDLKFALAFALKDDEMSWLPVEVEEEK